MLIVTAESAGGFYLTLMTRFSRDGNGEITFDETQYEREFVDGGFMEPVREVWRSRAAAN
ncbi:MAG: hypothetical protein NVSMB64_17320 [Candidatus Velthaea sp.]